MTKPEQCPCGSNNTFNQCCKPFLNGTHTASSPEILMRSRFSAFAVGNAHYLFQTSSQSLQSELSEASLAQSCREQKWLKLEVLAASDQQVEFKAYASTDDGFSMLHERSDFVLEDGQCKYHTGHLFNDSGAYTPERNALCLCGSGKKYKRCCA